MNLFKFLLIGSALIALSASNGKVMGSPRGGRKARKTATRDLIFWGNDGWNNDGHKPTPSPTKSEPINVPNPTKKPTIRPTRNPTRNPTRKPSNKPTHKPTYKPSPEVSGFETPRLFNFIAVTSILLDRLYYYVLTISSQNV